MKTCLICLCILLTIACNSRKKEIARLVKEWQNREIIFPDCPETKIFGRDTICPGLLTTKFKILNYTDTSGCTECKMKLYEWQQLKNQADSLKLNLSFVFVAWTKQYEELETLQAINKCNIPFIYDRNGKIMRQNHFPTETGFQTFLLDSANRVILIGNPVGNKTLWNLYLQKMMTTESH